MRTYAPSQVDRERDANNFLHHPPTCEDQTLRYEANRKACLGLATLLRQNCPPSRELSLALTKLEEVMFWCNAAIARNET